MDEPSNAKQIQAFLYEETDSKSINNIPAQNKPQIKNQKDLSNEILYFSINQDSK